MANYDFYCEDCKRTITVSMPMKDYKPLEKCPECNNKNIKRVFAPTLDIWKTGGAYGGGNRCIGR